MTEQHPLTEEMCGDIYDLTCEADAMMRFAYDLAVEKIAEQWEEVINSSRTNIQMIREFDKRLKAMRPQQQEDN